MHRPNVPLLALFLVPPPNLTTSQVTHITTSQVPHHNSVSPNAHLTMEHPALIVSFAPSISKLGFTSTRSNATRLPVSWTHSAMKSPSRRVRPPRTGVPLWVNVLVCDAGGGSYGRLTWREPTWGRARRRQRRGGWVCRSRSIPAPCPLPCRCRVYYTPH